MRLMFRGFLVVLVVLVVFGVVRNIRGKRIFRSGSETVLQGPLENTELRKLVDNGGRVAWYRGSLHEIIAYDAIVNKLNKNTEVFMIRPDGRNKVCVTCDSIIPKGFVGQPDWHPDGEHIVVQAENIYSSHRLYNHVAWGINQDLWIVKRDGTGAEKIWETPKNGAALHPHFSRDGKKIIFSERVATGRPIPALKDSTPGGENPWDGWRIHIADFDMNKIGTEKLFNHRLLFSETGGVYEAHSFSQDGDQIIYSHTSDGQAYMDDSFIATINGTSIRNLTNSPSTWEEHASFLPQGEKSFVFISSRADVSWVAPASKADTLRTELYLSDELGKISQLTDFNHTADPRKRYLVSDFDSDREGKRIVLQVAPVSIDGGVSEAPEIWLLTFLGKK